MLLLFVQKLFENTTMVNDYDPDLTTIMDKYQAGELSRDIDEKGAGGFWDLAKTVIRNYPPSMERDLEQVSQEGLYNTMLSLYEISLK